MCGPLLPPARNTPSTGNPANVLQQVSNLASLASVARGGYVYQLHYAACFSSMCPVCRRALRQLKCLASLVVPAAHGVLSQPTREYSVQPFQAIVTHGGFESPTAPAFAAGGRFTCQGATPAKTHVH